MPPPKPMRLNRFESLGIAEVGTQQLSPVLYRRLQTLLVRYWGEREDERPSWTDIALLARIARQAHPLSRLLSELAASAPNDPGVPHSDRSTTLTPPPRQWPVPPGGSFGPAPIVVCSVDILYASGSDCTDALTCIGAGGTLDFTAVQGQACHSGRIGGNARMRARAPSYDSAQAILRGPIDLPAGLHTYGDIIVQGEASTTPITHAAGQLTCAGRVKSLALAGNAAAPALLRLSDDASVAEQTLIVEHDFVLGANSRLEIRYYPATAQADRVRVSGHCHFAPENCHIDVLGVDAANAPIPQAGLKLVSGKGDIVGTPRLCSRLSERFSLAWHNADLYLKHKPAA